MSDVVVYTAIFGDRDSFRPPPDLPYDFRIFTDSKEFSTKEPRAIYTPFLVPGDLARSVRVVKSMPHIFLPGYKKWIWFDSSFDIKPGADLTEMVRRAGQIGAFPHHERVCVYDEAKICIDWKLDDAGVINAQMKRYRDQYRYPVRGGLAAGGVLVRENNPKICQFNENWWTEIALNSRRDQLSLSVMIRHLELPLVYLGSSIENPWFVYVGHKKH